MPISAEQLSSAVPAGTLPRSPPSPTSLQRLPTAILEILGDDEGEGAREDAPDLKSESPPDPLSL